jgi:hypothetical protein
MLEETGPDTWKPTVFSLALGDGASGDGASHMSATVIAGDDHITSSGLNIPTFLAKYEYRDPVEIAELDNYTDYTGGSSFFATCAADPEDKGASFIGMMAAIRNHKMDWTDVYDTNRLVQGADLSGNTPLFVDVGGAHGLDTKRLLAQHPDLPQDVLVVQDTPEVIEMSIESLDRRIKRMSYDFFTPQPVLGSRAYFFHAVPHDWPDADCMRIFEQVKKAFKKGYSKLLIYEIVLPRTGATSFQTTLDLLLMSCTSGLERTEDDWARMLKMAGFKIVDISRHARAVESVIEAELE